MTYQQLTLWEVPTQPGWVYIIQMGDGIVKIGWTGRSPFLRARELKGRLWFYMPGTKRDESDAHCRFQNYRIGRTEDFYLSRDVLAYVNHVRRNDPRRNPQDWPEAA